MLTEDTTVLQQNRLAAIKYELDSALPNQFKMNSIKLSEQQFLDRLFEQKIILASFDANIKAKQRKESPSSTATSINDPSSGFVKIAGIDEVSYEKDLFVFAYSWPKALVAKYTNSGMNNLSDASMLGEATLGNYDTFGSLWKFIACRKSIEDIDDEVYLLFLVS